MMTACPQCGAQIEFRYDDSFVRICAHCRAAVTRTDRGVESLGRVSDVAPIESPLALFATGTHGRESFILVGKAQLRHAAGGIWQEWYAKFDRGTWGWLAESQGNLFLTFEVASPPHQPLPLPAFHDLVPGRQVMLPTDRGPRRFTVGEVGVAQYLAADGELPFRLIPAGSFRFADLSDASGGYATIDFGDIAGGEPPTIYVGAQVRLDERRLAGGEAAPAGPSISSQRLACPSCDGSLQLSAPDAAMRVVCPYCNTLIDVQQRGALSIIAKLPQVARPEIPLGSRAELAEGAMTVIGYLSRTALVDGTRYPFDEYLLFAPQLGFRWLVCSDGHWSYVEPVLPGACELVRNHVRHEGRWFKHFQSAPLRVELVLGEFHWRVTVGEAAQSDDYVAPPQMLSREVSAGEVQWSRSTYLTRRELSAAFGGRTFGPGTGVAPNQPWPHRGVGRYLALLLAALLGLGVVFALSTSAREVTSFGVEVPDGPPDLSWRTQGGAQGAAAETAPGTEPVGHVYFSEPFVLKGGENIEIELRASVKNDWAYVVVDLIDDVRGTFLTFDRGIEYYEGVDGGERWTEGSPTVSEVLSPMPGGTYALRLEVLRGASLPPRALDLAVAVRQNVFRGRYFVAALVAMALLGAAFLLSWHRFEKRRWEDSNVTGGVPDSQFSEGD